ncbi:hypothetical protein BKA93DRAFT_72474 [Sparassis latifolia]
MAPTYTHPAAANYHSPPSHAPSKPRGARVCDQCGTFEQPSTGRFRLCGGCMVTQYCSQECQKAHWPSHKTICQHTASTVAAVKEPGAYDDNLAKNLRRFCSSYAELLGWAGFQALQLKRLPSNLRHKALMIEIEYHQSASDPLRRFSVKGTQIIPRSYVADNDPVVGSDILRREERCRKMGGIGTAVIVIQCSDVNQVMPVEVDAPSKISWDTRDDWADVLRHFVESGRTDFKPISTTPRGIVYG